MIDVLLERFQEHKEKEAIIWRDNSFSYEWILDRIRHWRGFLHQHSIKAGMSVSLEADFSPNSMTLFLALLEWRCILVPLADSLSAQNKEDFKKIAEVQVAIKIDDADNASLGTLENEINHEHIKHLQAKNHPGLILFSSGVTGKNKAAIHDFVPLLEKFKTSRRCYRSITFLLYDHIGGINTMLYILSNVGVMIVVNDRRPTKILETIEKHKVELLPTSPSFMNLLLLSKAYENYQLDSLTLVTYGTEPMTQATLEKFADAFPNVTLSQTYGLSELGIMRSKSENSRSLWVKLGGEGYDTRVVDGILHIKAGSAMLGYLNAPSPFTEDGWFNTQDQVEVKGEYFKILGRKSDIINVGGEKVYPTEVESTIQTLPIIADVTVYAEKNPLMGEIVCASVSTYENLPKREVVQQVKAHCRASLQPYKVPVKVKLQEKQDYSQRFKKIRVHTSQ